MKEPNKTPEKELNKMKISNLPEKEFKLMVIKILNFREEMNLVKTSTTG